MEVWKAIPDFTDYQVSNLGRVKSINARKGSRASVDDGIMRGWVQTNKHDYSRRLVTLRKNRKSHIFKVHRLVLEAFAGAAPNNMVCRHLDGNPLNNKLENLRWGTRKENFKDMVRHGTYSPPPTHKGEKHPRATVSDEVVASIRGRTLARGEAARLARELGVSQNTISRWNRGKSR